MSDAILHYVDRQTKKGELREVILADHDPKVIDVLAREMDQTLRGGGDADSADGAKPPPPPKRTGPVVMQPDGKMVVVVKNKRFLPGHNKHCTLLVTYDFPAGIQGVSFRVIPQTSRRPTLLVVLTAQLLDICVVALTFFRQRIFGLNTTGCSLTLL